MIAPPNRGSNVARRMRQAGFPLGGVFATWYGRAGAPRPAAQHGNPPATPQQLLEAVEAAEPCASSADALRWVCAGVQLGAEVAESDAWPLPPQPCGVIAGTRSLSVVNPTSWLTNTCRMLQGEGRRGMGDNPLSVIFTALPNDDLHRQRLWVLRPLHA